MNDYATPGWFFARWASLGRAIDVGGEQWDFIGDELITAWTEEHRHYHTLQHLGECLRLLDELRGWYIGHSTRYGWPVAAQLVWGEKRGPESERKHNLTELALWFHDAVYKPKAQGNEEESAAWLRVAMHSGPFLVEEEVKLVADAIMDTEHMMGPPLSALGSVVVSIDLAILAAPPGRFSEYEYQIRKEYADVEYALWRLGRVQVLGTFLSQPRIYPSDAFIEFEEQARRNLETALGRV